MSVLPVSTIGRRGVLPSAVAAFILLFLMAASSSVLFPQTTQEKPLQHQVSVSLKLVQVYATGKGGAPVTDLTAADFEVIDNGKSYSVTHLERHFLDAAETAPASTPAIAASPEVVAPMNRKFFLVFDFTFMDPPAVLRARNAALEFLDGDLQPSDEIGVISYLTTRGLVLNEYLTTDHGRVRSIIEGFSAKPRSGQAESLTQFIYSSDLNVLPGAGDPQPTAVDLEDQFYANQTNLQGRVQAGQGLGAPERQNYTGKARQLMIALGHLAKALRPIPGFKNIVLFSGGIARQYLYGRKGGVGMGDWTTPEQLAAQMKTYDGAQASASLRDDHGAMIREFKASNCPIYTIDVSRVRTGGDVQNQLGVSGSSLREFEGEDSLRQIAGETGGKFYAKTMEEKRVAEDIQRSTVAYYVLGYPVEETYDGKFHKIKVRVNRKGVDITAQGGYYSAKPFKDFTRFERLMHVVDLALGDAPQIQMPSDLPVAALPLTVKGWPRALVYARASRSALVDILADKSEAYLLLTDERDDVAAIRRFTLEPRATGKNAFYPSFLLPVKPGRYVCRFVVRNLETGRSARGSAALVMPPEKVAVLAVDPPLFLAPDTMSADLAAAPGSSVAELFGYDPNTYAPLIGDVAAGLDKLQAAMRIQGGAGLTGLTVMATLVDLATSARTEARVTVIRQTDDGPTRLLVVELATGGLKPGRYALECVAKEPSSGESPVASVGFTVK